MPKAVSIGRKLTTLKLGTMAGVAILVAALTAYPARTETTISNPPQYEKQVDYLQNLKSPLRPTGDQCKAMTAAFTDASRKISEAHDQCLNSGGAQTSGKTCPKASCQGLHDLRDLAQQRASAEAKTCSERASLVGAEQRESQARAQASQDAYRRQMQQAQQSAVPAQSVSSNVAASEPSAITRLCQGIASKEKCASLVGKVERFWQDPITGSVLENWKNSAAAAVEGGVHDVRPGLSAPAVSSAAGAASMVGGVVTSVGIGALDPDVAKGVKAIWDRRNNQHPADKILAEDEWNYATCGTLEDAGARQRLAQHDQARYLQFWNSCKEK